MTPKEKMWDLLNKMNGNPITSEDWDSASDYAKKTLAGECLIIVDEILSLGSLVGSNLSDTFYIYWQEIKKELENL